MAENKTNVKEGGEGLPSPQFSSLVLSIASSAALKMGLGESGKKDRDLAMARYNIDLLSLLKEKTKNNLSQEEQELLAGCVSDLQIQFINAKKREKGEK